MELIFVPSQQQRMSLVPYHWEKVYHKDKLLYSNKVSLMHIHSQRHMEN